MKCYLAEIRACDGKFDLHKFWSNDEQSAIKLCSDNKKSTLIDLSEIVDEDKMELKFIKTI